jgi:hypothetical protein
VISVVQKRDPARVALFRLLVAAHHHDEHAPASRKVVTDEIGQLI